MTKVVLRFGAGEVGDELKHQNRAQRVAAKPTTEEDLKDAINKLDVEKVWSIFIRGDAIITHELSRLVSRLIARSEALVAGFKKSNNTRKMLQEEKTVSTLKLIADILRFPEQEKVFNKIWQSEDSTLEKINRVVNLLYKINRWICCGNGNLEKPDLVTDLLNNKLANLKNKSEKSIRDCMLKHFEEVSYTDIRFSAELRSTVLWLLARLKIDDEHRFQPKKIERYENIWRGGLGTGDRVARVEAVFNILYREQEWHGGYINKPKHAFVETFLKDLEILKKAKPENGIAHTWEPIQKLLNTHFIAKEEFNNAPRDLRRTVNWILKKISISTPDLSVRHVQGSREFKL